MWLFGESTFHRLRIQYTNLSNSGTMAPIPDKKVSGLQLWKMSRSHLVVPMGHDHVYELTLKFHHHSVGSWPTPKTVSTSERFHHLHHIYRDFLTRQNKFLKKNLKVCFVRSMTMRNDKQIIQIPQTTKTNWWSQPIPKVLVKMGIFPR